MTSPIQTAELLSVGTELLLGEIVDTNSAYLAADLATRGVDIYWSQRVGDNLNRIKTAIQQALNRSDLLVMCGGLGPTDDDLSREAIAATLHETPSIDPQLELWLRERFALFSRRMPERNLKQAWLIPSARALANPLGTAPGWFVNCSVAGKPRVIVALPGPPRELKRMWLHEVLPLLSLPESALFTRTFKTMNMGESTVADLLGELTLQANPSVATYAKRDGVHVRVAAKAATSTEAAELAAPVVTQVQGLLESGIWGVDEDELPDLVREGLLARGLSVGSFETLSAGALAEVLSYGKQSTSVYKGGVVAWDMQAQAAFGVSETRLQLSHEASAFAMADAAAALLKTDIGLAAFGVTDRGELEEHVSEVYIAVSGALGRELKVLTLPLLEADWIRERITYASLYLLWSVLNA